MIHKNPAILYFGIIAGYLILFTATTQGAWPEVDKLLASDSAADDFFGTSTSISGNYAIIGASGDNNAKGQNAGSAYIFKRSGEADDPNWYEQTKLIASDGSANDRFGRGVSVDGVYAIVGAPDDDDAGYSGGSAYIFKRSDNPNDPNWYEQVKIAASDAAANHYFGEFVSISGDYAVVGAYGNKCAYIFKRSVIPDDPNWYEQAKLTPSGGSDSYFGWSVSISGDYVIIGTKAELAYIFKRNGTSWTQQDMLSNDGQFGRAVSISGQLAIVGAWEDWDDINGPYCGSAYIYTPNDIDPNNWDEQARLTASDGGPDEYFGTSVSISGDYVVVGADSDKAYIFKRKGKNWTEKAILTASDYNPEALDAFGESVAINGIYAVVGARENDDYGTNSGSAYVFKEVCPAADLNSDCFVDFVDFAILAGQWLQ